jgi:hypothetical protein
MSANAEVSMPSTASASTLNVSANSWAFTPSSTIVGTWSGEVITLDTVGPLLDTILDNGINQGANLDSSNGVVSVAVPISGNDRTQSADNVSENGGAQRPRVVSDNVTTENNDTTPDNGTGQRARSNSDKSIDQSTGSASDNGTSQIVDSGSNNVSIAGLASAQSFDQLSHNGKNAKDAELDAILKALVDALHAAYPSLDHKANDYSEEGLENLGNTQPPEWLAAGVEQEFRAIALSNPDLHYHIRMQTFLIHKMLLTIQRNGQAFKGLGMETTRVCKELQKKQQEIELLKADKIVLKGENGDIMKAHRSFVQGLTRKYDEKSNAHEQAMEKLRLENAELVKQAQEAEPAKDEARGQLNRVKVLEEKYQRRADDATQASEQLKERNRQLEEEFKL